MNASQVTEVAGRMVDAAKGVLGDDWPEAKNFVEAESRKFAQSLGEIALWMQEGDIDEEEAAYLAGMHKRSMKMVMTAAKGISLVMAERAINAAIDEVRSTVNGIVGWVLL